MTDFFIRQVERRLERLEEDADLVFDAAEMRRLLGDEYVEYSRSIAVALTVGEPDLDHITRSWWQAARELLQETRDALNRGRVRLNGETARQKQQREQLQSRAEELMRQFEADVSGTKDEAFFTIREGMAELAHDDPFAREHHLLEHWVLPTLDPLRAGIDRRAYKRQMQRQALEALLPREEDASPPDAETETQSRVREMLLKRKDS